MKLRLLLIGTLLLAASVGARAQTYNVSGPCQPPNATVGEYCFNLPTPLAALKFTSGGTVPATVYLDFTTPSWHEVVGTVTVVEDPNFQYHLAFTAHDSLTGTDYTGSIAGDVTVTRACYRYCHVNYSFIGTATFN